MIHIFNTLTSKAPAIRRFPPDGNLSELHWIRFGNRRFLTRHPLWVRFEERSRDTVQSSTDRWGQGRIICTTGPWTPHTANMSQLPFHIKRGRKVLRSPERKQGLADVTRETGRIKEFRLNDALLYSYMYDLRFVLLTCLVIGFSIWWMAVPEPLLESPKALCSPDLEMLVNVARDTYVNKAAVGVASTARLVWIGRTSGKLPAFANHRVDNTRVCLIYPAPNHFRPNLAQFFHKISPDPVIDRQKVHSGSPDLAPGTQPFYLRLSLELHLMKQKVAQKLITR
nr:hypothetical protein CFP56_76685 [Quercus suber]